MAFAKNDVVRFDFTIDSPVAGRRGERRTGVGVIANGETAYECWPPGRYVSVISSDHYKPGTIIAVATHNLARQ